MARMASRYASLRRYADVGRVRSLDGARATLIDFHTVWRRPKAFSFEFSVPHPYPPLRHRRRHYRLARTGRRPSFANVDDAGEHAAVSGADFETCVARATGVSFGAAHTIATLLFSDAGASSLARLRGLRRAKAKTRGGVACVGLRGVLPGLGRFSVYLGAQDGLLRELISHRLKAAEQRWAVRAR